MYLDCMAKYLTISFVYTTLNIFVLNDIPVIRYPHQFWAV